MPQFSSNPYEGGTDHTSEFDAADIAESRVMSALAYLFILFFLPLVFCKDSRFGRFHANQGLVLFITCLILGAVEGIVSFVLHIIPFLGALAAWLISLFIGLLMIALIAYGILNTLNGKARELPLIGKIHILD